MNNLRYFDSNKLFLTNDDVKKDASMGTRLCLKEFYSMHCSWEHNFTNSQEFYS